jgi:protein transport protein SEC24
LDSGEPEMMVVSDVEDVFLPVPDGLLVSLTDCRLAIDSLLAKLPQLFPPQSAQPAGNALGTAIQAAFKMIVSLPTGQSPLSINNYL